MNRTLRALAIPAAAALTLTGCSALPFEIVPKDREATPTAEMPTEEAETEAEAAVEEPTEESFTLPASALFETVQAICQLPDEALADEGLTLLLNTEGTDPGTGDLSMEDLGCALGSLEVPDSIVAKMEDTSALDGRQEAEDDGLIYSWSYTPKYGLDVIVTNERGPITGE